MGKITFATQQQVRVPNLRDPAVRRELQREAERVAREEQRNKLAHSGSIIVRAKSDR